MTWPTSPQPASTPTNYDALLGAGRAMKSASFKGQFPIRWEGIVQEAAKKPAFKYDPSKPNNRGEQMFWPDGNPVEYLWVTIQTNVRTDQDDDGRRVLVLDSKNKVEAVQDAVRESGVSFQQGSYIALEWYGNDPHGKNPDNPPKLYRALHRGPTLDAALGMPQPAAPAGNGQWGAPAASAPAVSSPGAGWGATPEAQTNVAAAGWGAPAPAPVPAPAAPPATGWGGAPAEQVNPAAAGWGAPAPTPAPPVQAPPAGPPADPGLVAALQAKGVTVPPGTTHEAALGLWALYGNQ